MGHSAPLARGILGIEVASHTTLTEPHPRHSIESCMQHFEYAVRLIGIEHLGFGPDWLLAIMRDSTVPMLSS